MRAVRDWMTEKDIDRDSAQQILKYMNQKHQQQSGMDEAHLLAELPPTLSKQISRHLYTEFLSSVPLFRGLDKEIVYKLCEKMVPMLAMKLQQIIQEGQVGAEMYFVLKGEVEVTKKMRRSTLEPEKDYRLGFLSEVPRDARHPPWRSSRRWGANRLGLPSDRARSSARSRSVRARRGG
jgi:hypothetical protein